MDAKQVIQQCFELIETNPIVLASSIILAAIVSTNKLELIGPLVQHALEQNKDKADRLHLFLMLRETLVKCAAVIGMPKCINASAILQSQIPEGLIEDLNKEAIRDEPITAQELDLRGRIAFNMVYTTQADKVRCILKQNNPDLSYFIKEIYDKIISQNKILDLKSTELIMVACLYPQDVPKQLKSHTLGCSKLGVQQQLIDNTIQVAKFIIEFES